MKITFEFDTADLPHYTDNDIGRDNLYRFLNSQLITGAIENKIAYLSKKLDLTGPDATRDTYEEKIALARRMMDGLKYEHEH